jgi:hypothetical protein
VNQDALQAMLNDLVTRHESLRTIFTEIDGSPVANILPPQQACPIMEGVDTSEVQLAAALTTAASYGFDLASEIPLRAWLFRLAEQQHVLLLLVHHIAGDGWSLAPLSHDLAIAYAARCQGQAPEWSPLPVQYTDYTLWQLELLGHENDPDSLLAHQLTYWQQALAQFQKLDNQNGALHVSQSMALLDIARGHFSGARERLEASEVGIEISQIVEEMLS